MLPDVPFLLYGTDPRTMSFFKSIPLKKSRIAGKLIAAIILFSSMITLIITAYQLLTDYRFSVENVHDRVDEIGTIQIRTLEHAVWKMDEATIKKY